jgi:uncharacterized membrane-anchored protein YhcB (DUF1043 family)
MILFFLGLFIGVALGIIFAALLREAARNDGMPQTLAKTGDAAIPGMCDRVHAKTSSN